MECTNDDRVGYGHNSSFLPTPGGQALIQGRPVGPFGMRGGVGYLGQAAPQRVVALAGLPRSAFPRAFGIAGGDARLRAQPPRISFVRPAPGDPLHIGHNDQKPLKVPFQEVEHRLPVLANALSRHRGDPHCGQPVRQGEQCTGQGPQVLKVHQSIGLLARRIGKHPTSRDPLLMDVQSRKMSEDHLYSPAPEQVAGGIPRCRGATWRALLPTVRWRPSLIPQLSGPNRFTGSWCDPKHDLRARHIYCILSSDTDLEVVKHHFPASWCPSGHDNCFVRTVGSRVP